MAGLVEIATNVVNTTGVIGAIIIAILIGLVAALILWVRVSSSFADTRTATQQGEFQKKLLDAIDRLAKIETALRHEIEQLQSEKEQLQRSFNEATVSVDLMRNQQRRLIDLFRDVLAGKRALDSIDLGEIGA